MAEKNPENPASNREKVSIPPIEELICQVRDGVKYLERTDLDDLVTWFESRHLPLAEYSSARKI